MAVSFPLSLARFMDILAVAEISFDLPEAIETTETGGEILTADFETRLWQREIRLGEMDPDDAAEVLARLDLLRRAGGSFMVTGRARPWPRADFGGALPGGSAVTLHRVAASTREVRLGFWTGEDHRSFAIRGEARSYYGAGNLVEVDPIRRETGLKVRSQRLKLSQITPEGLLAVRGYDLRHAPVEIHRVLFDPLTLQLLAEPDRKFSGFVDRVRISTPARGGNGAARLTLASAARALTTPLARYRSDAALRARVPADAFRQYAGITSEVQVKWGMADATKKLSVK